MLGRPRTWLWVIVAVVVVSILALVAVAGAALYFVSRHIETTTASSRAAAREFEAVKTMFPQQQPLIELDSGGEFLRANTDRAGTSPTVPSQLHLLAFDPEDGRIVRFNLPFWLLRLNAGDTEIDLNGARMDLADLRLSVDDLERFGPSLIVDHQAPGGARVLVWSR